MTEEFIARVLQVTDGDTFRISPRIKNMDYVRIANVDTPEKGHPRHSEAKNFLEGLILNKQVTLVMKGIDTYHRIIASVYINNQNIESLIKNKGW